MPKVAFISRATGHILDIAVQHSSISCNARYWKIPELIKNANMYLNLNGSLLLQCERSIIIDLSIFRYHPKSISSRPKNA